MCDLTTEAEEGLVGQVSDVSAERCDDVGGSVRLLQDTDAAPALDGDARQGASSCRRASRIALALTMVAVALTAGCAVTWFYKTRTVGYHAAAPLQVKQVAAQNPQLVAQKPQCTCQSTTATLPQLYYDDFSSAGTDVKVMTYNLFWWNLYGLRGGNSDSASRLIQQANSDGPFDVLGFQECENIGRVMNAAGMLEYELIPDSSAGLCTAVHRGKWSIINQGVQYAVACDAQYGARNAQWVRLRGNSDGRTLFFVNHHGPLPLNSGGVCGGYTTAHNLLQVVASNAQPGDAVVVVGDFNADGNSQTVRTMQQQLDRVYNGITLGGIDNVFSSRGIEVVATQNLGSGGSDHDALSVTLHLGPTCSMPVPVCALLALPNRIQAQVAKLPSLLAPTTGSPLPFKLPSQPIFPTYR